MNFSNYKFRASSIGKLMVEPRSKSETLSETTKSYLKQLHREERYNRRRNFSNKYIEKGLQCEEDGITLFSRVKKRYFKKNDRRLTNEFVTGEPDLFIGLEIASADEGFDIKVSWDLFTFPYPGDKLSNDYYWQNQTYMALTGAKRWTTAFTLVNTPDTLLEDEKRKLMWKMNAGTTENKEFIEACEELDKAMIYDDIPLNERVIEFQVQRDDAEIEAMYLKVAKCREYLNNLEKAINPNWLIAEYIPNDKITLVS